MMADDVLKIKDRIAIIALEIDIVRFIFVVIALSSSFRPEMTASASFCTVDGSTSKQITCFSQI